MKRQYLKSFFFLIVSGGEGRSSREGPNNKIDSYEGHNMNGDLLNDSSFNHDFDPDDLDDPEEDVDGIRRDPTYPYHPCDDADASKSNKQHDPHQKYHHYNGYNHPTPRKGGKPQNIRSSDSSKENIKRHQKNSQLPPSHPKRQGHQQNTKYYSSQKKSGVTDIFDSTNKKRDIRSSTEPKNMSSRRKNLNRRNVEQAAQKARSKESRKNPYIPSPYHEANGEHGDSNKIGKEKGNGLIKNHTKLMDQIMDDLIAEATDNEGQYYLDLAGNVRKVLNVY